jgi:hypothetical protein
MNANVHRLGKSRADLLAEIENLPSSAFVNTAQAAAYIGSSPGVLLNWRSQRRGPRYHGSKDFVRYRISDLDSWMSARAGEVRLAADDGARNECTCHPEC